MSNFDKLQKWMKKNDIYDNDLFNELKKFKIYDPDYDFNKIDKKTFNGWAKKMEKQINVEYSKNLKKKGMVQKKLIAIKKQWKKQSSKKKKNAVRNVVKTNNNTNNDDIKTNNISPKKAKKVSKKKAKKKDIYSLKNTNPLKGIKPYIFGLIIAYFYRKNSKNRGSLDDKIFYIIAKYCPIFTNGFMGTLIINQDKEHELRSDICHNFEKIILKDGATLTVMPYETKTTKQNPKKLDGKGGHGKGLSLVPLYMRFKYKIELNIL